MRPQSAETREGPLFHHEQNPWLLLVVVVAVLIDIVLVIAGGDHHCLCDANWGSLCNYKMTLVCLVSFGSGRISRRRRDV